MSVKVIFGDVRNMKELDDKSIQLVVSSSPYYNVPFDFPGLFKDYNEYLKLIEDVGREMFRVLEKGRVACFIIQDVRIDGELYSIVADIIEIMKKIGLDTEIRLYGENPKDS